MNQRIYWDSCVFIHYFQQTAQFKDALNETVRRAKAEEYLIATSAVTIAEVYKLPELGELPVEQSDGILDFFKNKHIELWQADRWVCTEAHHLMRHHPLLPMDAIHLATALAMNPCLVVTTDTKKYRRNGLLSIDGKIGNPPLKIKTPDIGFFLPLFKATEKDKSERKEPQEEAAPENRAPQG